MFREIGLIRDPVMQYEYNPYSHGVLVHDIESRCDHLVLPEGQGRLILWPEPYKFQAGDYDWIEFYGPTPTNYADMNSPCPVFGVSQDDATGDVSFYAYSHPYAGIEQWQYNAVLGYWGWWDTTLSTFVYWHDGVGWKYWISGAWVPWTVTLCANQPTSVSYSHALELQNAGAYVTSYWEGPWPTSKAGVYSDADDWLVSYSQDNFGRILCVGVQDCRILASTATIITPRQAYPSGISYARGVAYSYQWSQWDATSNSMKVIDPVRSTQVITHEYLVQNWVAELLHELANPDLFPNSIMNRYYPHVGVDTNASSTDSRLPTAVKELESSGLGTISHDTILDCIAPTTASPYGSDVIRNQASRLRHDIERQNPDGTGYYSFATYRTPLPGILGGRFGVWVPASYTSSDRINVRMPAACYCYVTAPPPRTSVRIATSQWYGLPERVQVQIGGATNSVWALNTDSGIYYTEGTSSIRYNCFNNKTYYPGYSYTDCRVCNLPPWCEHRDMPAGQTPDLSLSSAYTADNGHVYTPL